MGARPGLAWLVPAALLVLLCARGAAAQSNRTISEDRLLILTDASGVSADNRMIAFIEQQLVAANLAYDVAVLDKAAAPAAKVTVNGSQISLADLLWTPAGIGRYRGYHMYPNLEAIGSMAAAEVATLWDFQLRTGARSAKFGAWVTTLGFAAVDYSACGSAAQTIAFTAAAPLGGSGVSSDAAMTSAGLYKCPGSLSSPPLGACNIWANDFASTGIIAPCNSSAIAVFKGDAALGPVLAVDTVAGVTISYADGRESMAFVFDCAAWSSTCGTLAQVATAWMRAGGALVSPPLPPKPISLNHRMLLLTTPGFTNTEFLEKAMQGYGMPYQVVPFNKDATPRVDLRALLWDATDGSGRFSAVTMYPNIEAMGVLNRTEVLTIWDYQRRTGARMLKFAAWPSNLGYVPNLDACGSDDVPFRFTSAAPLGISGIKANAPLTGGGLYRCPGTGPPAAECPMWASDFADTGLRPGCAVTSVMEADAGVVGALVKYTDGREALAFTFDCGAWQTSCMAVAHVAISWAMQDVIPGERRPLLTLQFDDLFLDTPVDGGTDYRIGVSDLVQQVQWQRTGPAAAGAAPGSDIRFEMPFNGNGVLDYASRAGGAVAALSVDDAGCLDMPQYKLFGCNCWTVGWQACTHPNQWCRQCTKDYPKPLGTGANRVPGTISTTWPVAQLAFDPLAKAVMSNTGGIATDYFYSHHTFTHQNLDNATEYDATQQLGLNQIMATRLSLATRPSYSSKCMVTPQISGLVNGDVLSAFTGKGMLCATGDNTWAHLKNTTDPHSMRYSTRALNGFNGFAILPRFATEIFYNCTTVPQQETLYNNIYGSYYGQSTINDILAREARRVVRDAIFALRKDPHMMHQGNLRLDDTGKSLATRWVEAVVAELSKYASWPLVSLKLDDLYAAFKAREARDACRLSYRLTIGPDASITSVNVTSAAATGGAACTAPLVTAGGPMSGSLQPGGSVVLPGAGLPKWSAAPK